MEIYLKNNGELKNNDEKCNLKFLLQKIQLNGIFFFFFK